MKFATRVLALLGRLNLLDWIAIVACVILGAFLAAGAGAQCDRTPATMPPAALWGPLIPLTSTVLHDHTPYKGVGVPPNWWEFIGPTGFGRLIVVVQGPFLRLVSPLADGSLPPERNMLPARSVFENFRENEGRGEVDVFLGNAATDANLGILALSSPNPTLGLTFWNPALDPLFRFGVAGHEVACAGGLCFYATKEQGVALFDLGEILDCAKDLGCMEPADCAGTRLDNLPTLRQKPVSVSSALHRERLYAVVSDSVDVEVFLLDSGVFVRVRPLSGLQAWSVRLFTIGDTLYLATRSVPSLQIWELEGCPESCAPRSVWKDDTRARGKPGLSVGKADPSLLFSFDRSTTCAPDSLDILLHLAGLPTNWKRLDVGPYLGHISAYAWAQGRGGAERYHDGELLIDIVNHGTLTTHRVELAEPLPPDFVFADGFESGDASSW